MRTAVYSSYSPYPVVEARKQKPKSHIDSANTARRIKSNVKQNLRLVELREQRSGTNEPMPVTRFRRKKGVKEQEERDITLEQEWETGELVVLVDAYNLCGYWEKLKPDFRSGRLNIARDKLIDSLVMYSEVQEVKVVAVFDAAKSSMRTRKENVFGVDVVYSGGTEADDWILTEVENLRNAGSPVLVITSDIHEQNASLQLGASVWNCRTFVKELQDSEEEYNDIIKRDRVSIKKSDMPVKYDLPMAIPALKTLKKKLLDELSSNEGNSETSTAPSSTPDPAATNPNSTIQTNGSSRKRSFERVKLNKRGYGSFFHTLNDLQRKISS